MKKIIRSFINTIIVLMVLAIVLLLIYFCINFFIDKKTTLYFEWMINIPKPDKIDVIYNYDYREGEDFEIWSYNEASKIKEISNNKKFKNVEETDKEFIVKKLDNYYNSLTDDEKKLFDKNLENPYALLKVENCFFFSNKKNDKNTWTLLILNCESGKLYYFARVR